jgi:DNA-binding NtrC family response regulator
VLIVGESGVGKELIARALHEEGPRSKKPFVAVNVTALPRELVESELFGHERGAFTGAVARRDGAFAEAAGGTLFLDEVGDLALEVQPKLLRALDGYDVRRVGGTGQSAPTNARVVAATNATLERAVVEGRFRRDLFHRLEVFVIQVPALRDRRGDIGAIAKSLAKKMVGDGGPRELTPAALARLTAHDWPGNVRELRNTIEYAFVLCHESLIGLQHLPPRLTRTKPGNRAHLPTDTRDQRDSLRTSALVQERDRLVQALREAGGSRSRAAELLGVSRVTVWKRIKKFGLQAEG